MQAWETRAASYRSIGDVPVVSCSGYFHSPATPCFPLVAFIALVALVPFVAIVPARIHLGIDPNVRSCNNSHRTWLDSFRICSQNTHSGLANSPLIV